MAKVIETIKDFAELVYTLNKSDRDVNLACGGFTGEGKTTFVAKLQMEYARLAGTPWDFSHMTWNRKELMRWVDGDPKSEKDPYTGLKDGQKPEYSAILADELFLMFYRRNWQDQGQIDAIATLNMCRDRHLFLAGNVPNFWDLDTAFQERMRFYVYIPRGRGVAWIFQQEDNPFCVDNWNKSENTKQFRKYKNPYKCPNFVCEVEYPNWTPEEKKEYCEIRNTKRVSAIQDNKKEKIERYGKIKEQRDKAIVFGMKYNHQMTKLFLEMMKCQNCKDAILKDNLHKPFSMRAWSEITGLSHEAIRCITYGNY